MDPRKADVRRPRLSALLCIAMVGALASCEFIAEQLSDVPPQVRTDAAPLLARLALPPTTSAVRWIAVTSHNGTSRIPGVTDGVFIFAYIALTQNEWAILNKGVEQSSVVATAKAPEKIWRYILPAPVLAAGKKVGDEIAITGVATDSSRLLREKPKVYFEQAIRVEDALVMELFVPNGQ